jgi:hypothetical protein
MDTFRAKDSRTQLRDKLTDEDREMQRLLGGDRPRCGLLGYLEKGLADRIR